MSKLKLSASKKFDAKIGQPKISTFFKKKNTSLSDQESTSFKYTHIKPYCEVVDKSPEHTLAVSRFGDGTDEDVDLDIIPPTPPHCQSMSRSIMSTKSRVFCSKPECEVIPPTPPKIGKKIRPNASLAYKLLKSKCDVGQIQPNCLSTDRCREVMKPLGDVINNQELHSVNVVFGSPLLADDFNLKSTCYERKSADIDTRVAKRLKTEKQSQSGIENISPFCQLSVPVLVTKNTNELNKIERLPHDNANAPENDQSNMLLSDDEDFWKEFTDGSELDNTNREERIDSGKDSSSNIVNNSFRDDLPIRKYNRHKVRQIVRNKPGEVVMTVSPLDCDSTLRTCILKGFWADTQACDGDIVNILGEFDESGVVVMGGNQAENLLVVNPDFLVSSTTVVSGVFCRRKAVLNEWFRAVEPRSIHMLVGIFVHQLFQEASEKRLTTPQEIRRLLAEITSRKKNLLEIYGFQGDKDFGRLYSDLESFVKPVGDWIRRHIVGCGQPLPHGANGIKNCKKVEVDVKQICDIEENVWCPRLGLKGKLDMVIETSTDGVVPLELKTGRPTFSAEHQGQVTLYKMMSRDRRPKDVNGEGLLLYLRTAECHKVKHKDQAQQQLIQMRNDITWHLAKPIIHATCHSEERQAEHGWSLAPLPDPLSSQRVCSGCPMLTVCSLFPSHEDVAYSNGEFAGVSLKAINHLIQEEPQHFGREYFSKWCLNVFLEDLCTKNSLQLKDVWCKISEQREERGECFSGMVLKPLDGKRQGNIHRFERCAGHRKGKSLAAVGFECMQTVVVSVEKKHLIALSTGQLKDVQEYHVDVVLDRDLYSKGEYDSDMFRIDAYRPQTYSVTALSNLARLMSNSTESTRLRAMIIGHEPLKDKLIMSKAMAKIAKPFFKDLNRGQKIAVLKSLVTKDYMLIEGTPGSGKTKTVVAIIRMLLHMKHTILLASHTHSAVDNVLLKLKEKGVKNFIRLGKMEKVHPELLDQTSDRLLNEVDSLEKINEVFNSKQLVATTCLGSNHGMFQFRKEFDYCIIDEATQILQPICLGPLFLCKRFILVGDPQQLPPIVRSPDAKKEGMDESLFALLKSKEDSKDESLSAVGSRLQLLSEQYRMNAEIMRFSNSLSYYDKLECGSANEFAILNLPKLDKVRQLLHGGSLLNHIASGCLEESVLLLNTDLLQTWEEMDSWGKVCSHIEASITLEIVAFFLTCGLNADQVGVISPYRNQVALIKKVLAQKKMEEPQQFSEMSEVEVNTIDQYQGREKDAVIISFVGRSQTAAGQMDQEILNDKRRINVAITRAKTKMVMIGSREILNCYAPLEEMLKLMRTQQVINLPGDCISTLLWPLKTEHVKN